MSTPTSVTRPQETPGPPKRGPWRSRVSDHVRVPLYREAYALVLNSGLVSVFGLLYWLLAAHNYSPHVLGLNSAAISAMIFLAGISQLNLMSALMRFIPVAGRNRTRFVLSSYLLSACIAAGVSLVFLLGLGTWTPDLGFLTSNAGFVLWFMAATIAWCVFNLQDSVLTGLRAAVFVPIENVAYSVAKIALLVALVDVSPHYGIFASWTAALLVSIVPVNLLIYGRLLRRGGSTESRLPSRRQLAKFVSADYLGAMFWLTATALMPVIVVALEGPTANAYFSLAWMVALPLFAVSASTGASLVVTASADEARLPTYARRVLIQTAAIVIPSALVLAVAASQVLTLFGDKYASHSATTLALLALSAIPNVVNALSVSVYRVQRRMSRVVMLLGFQCGLALVLGIVLLEAMGIAGIGLAWLISQSLVALAVMVLEPQTLLGPPGTGGLGMAVRSWAANLGFLGLLLRLRRGPANLRRARAARHLTPKIVASIPQGPNGDRPTTWMPHRFLPTVSDVAVITVGPSGQAPRAVIKLPTSSSARGTLRREADILAALGTDPRLDDWRDVLPTVLATGQVDDQPFLVQRMVSGVAAGEMLGTAGAASQAVLTAAALEIRGLHERTAASAVVGPAALERWVNGPASLAHHVSAALVGRKAAKLATDRLSDELRGTLEGRTLPLSWIHGDYVPGNILVSPGDASVVGIIDWELAGAADPPLLDVVSLLVTTRAQQRHEELGQVVREYVTGAPWTDYEQHLIEAASLQRPGEGIDARTAILLWWLRHVSGNLTKSTRYARSRLWARVCVWAVLDVFGPSDH